MNCNCDQKTQELVILAQQGDDSALEQLCRVHGERVRRIIRLRMGKEIRPRLDSMDLVEDALVSALGGLGDFTYKNEGDFLRWLSKITQNALRDNLDKLYTAKRDIRKELRIEHRGQRPVVGVSAFPAPLRPPRRV